MGGTAALPATRRCFHFMTVKVDLPAAKPVLRSARNKAPVFVLGSPRSGTTLLYHMLLSAGNFAVYRTESQVFNLLEPRFGDLRSAGNRSRLLAAWLKTRLFTATGLSAERVSDRVMAECRNGGDFLKIVMEETARQQSVERWADCTPEHLLYIERIKKTIPNALIIQIVRDGRDVALSLEKQAWIRPLPWHKGKERLAAGLYWEWIVQKGRESGLALGPDYTEIRFEELLAHPRETVAKVGRFIDQELDYDEILRVGIGSVHQPNTSFGGDTEQEFSPVGRWRSVFSESELAEFEGLVGSTLESLGYELGANNRSRLSCSGLRRLRMQYRRYFDGKRFLKARTPLGKLLVTRDLSWV
jgi:hypothetical protein